MVKQQRYKELGFYKCRTKLWLNKIFFLGVDLPYLIQIDDTDFPSFSKKQNGWTLDKIHKWITVDNNGVGGTVNISKKQLKYALDLCTSPTKEVKKIQLKVKKRREIYLIKNKIIP